MPLPRSARLISTDDHVIEHPNVWQDRLPAKHREVGPRFVEYEGELVDAAGNDISGRRQLWVYEGRLYPNFALNAVVDKDPTNFGIEPQRFEDILPGCYDPVARVKDMDRDGIQASLCFPTFPKLCGATFLASDDKELGLLCVRAYNDFILDEWCAAAPDRLIPMVLLPLWDDDASVAEIARTAARGARAVSFPETPWRLGLHSFHDGGWRKVLAAIEDADMAMCLHFGSSGMPPESSPDAPQAMWIATMGTNSMVAASDLAYSPVFHEFPRLRVALNEGGIGWMPYMWERLDYVWERHRWWTGLAPDRRPSDLVREHIWGCFIDDRSGIDNRAAIGVDRITWECDYPHSDSNWPSSRSRLEVALRDVPEDEAIRIAELNARELLRFDADLIA